MTAGKKRRSRWGLTGIKVALILSTLSMSGMTIVSSLPTNMAETIETANDLKALGFAGLLCLVSLGLLGGLLYNVRRREAEQLMAREDSRKAHDEHTQLLYGMIRESTKAAEQVRDVGIRTIVVMERVDDTMKRVNMAAEARVSTCKAVLEHVGK